MADYAPTREQEQAIREYLHESIVPLIEQVLVKKLGQAMSYAAQELVNQKRKPLRGEQFVDMARAIAPRTVTGLKEQIPTWIVEYGRAIEAAHGITGEQA